MLKLLKFFIYNILCFVMYKMTILSKTKSHSDVIHYFKELPFYNKPIKKQVKRFKNIDEIAEPLSVIKTDQALKEYAM